MCFRKLTRHIIGLTFCVCFSSTFGQIIGYPPFDDNNLQACEVNCRASMLESCENKSIQARYWGCAEGAPGIYGACYGYCFGQNMSALIQERYQSCMNDYKDKSPTQSSLEQFCTNYSRAIPL